MFRKFHARAAAIILCVAAMPAAFAADDAFGRFREGFEKFTAQGTFSLGAGVNYSSGDYGTGTDTKILSIPITGRFDTGPWSLKLTVPFLRVSGGTGAIPGIGRANNTNPLRRGIGSVELNPPLDLGDVVASATYAAYYNQASRFGVDLTGKVKFGTADEDKGLGTGENDYGAQVDIFKTYGSFTLFGGVGYTLLGSSQYISLDDVFNVNVGGSYRLDDRSNAGLSYDWREKTSAAGSNLSEVTAFLSRRLDKSWKAQVYVLKGFSDGSPDWGLGASAAYAF
jgi:hypothetical protein